MSNKPLPLDAVELHDSSDPQCENHRGAKANGFPARPERTCPACIHNGFGGYYTPTAGVPKKRPRKRATRATGAVTGA